MTLRTFTRVFCFGCLATSKQKWRENENLTNFSVSSVVVYFLSRYVLKAESWVPRPPFYPLSIGSLGFLKKWPLIRYRGLNAKLHVFLPRIFSVFILFLKYKEKRYANFSSTYRDCQGLSNHIFFIFLSLTLRTVGPI